MFINQKKKQYICAGRKKKIISIIVNERPNTPVGYRKRIRQEMHYIAKFGLKDHMEHIGCTASEERYLQSLLGRIEYVLSIDRSKEFEEYKKQIDVLLKKEEDSK